MIIGVIPCKANSNRLPEKNFQKIDGKTLLQRAIDYLKTSRYIDRIDVYTDDMSHPKIIEHGDKNPLVGFHPDPSHGGYLCDFYPALFTSNLSHIPLTHIVSTTPDNPIRPNNLDDLIIFAQTEGLHELISFDENHRSTGAIRIISREALEHKYVSGYTSYVVNKGIDIHTSKDLMKAREMCLTNPSK